LRIVGMIEPLTPVARGLTAGRLAQAGTERGAARARLPAYAVKRSHDGEAQAASE